MARPNEADRGTDRALADLERRINSVYSQAAKELQEEITHLESKTKQKPAQSTEPVPTTPPEEASEDHTKYMPKS